VEIRQEASPLTSQIGELSQLARVRLETDTDEWRSIGLNGPHG